MSDQIMICWWLVPRRRSRFSTFRYKLGTRPRHVVASLSYVASRLKLVVSVRYRCERKIQVLEMLKATVSRNR